MNIGAKDILDPGDYYAWGEFLTRDKYVKSNGYQVSYNNKKISGDPEYDIATKIMGGNWRMPTVREINELFTLPWKYYNDWDLLSEDDPSYHKEGEGTYIEFEGKNGAKLIIPNSGSFEGDSVELGDNCTCEFWTGDQNFPNKDEAWQFYVDFDATKGQVNKYTSCVKYYGLPVRGVF